MKSISFLLTFFTLIAMRQECFATNNPCQLIALEKVQELFPVVEKMEKKNYGVNQICNYINKQEIPVITVSTGSDNISPRTMMSNLGDGYVVQDMPSLGDEAAMALTLPEPKLGIAGDLVVELCIRKGDTYLLLAPSGVEIEKSGSLFTSFLSLARAMLQSIH